MPILLRCGLDKLLFRPLIKGIDELSALSKSITDWRVAQGNNLTGDLFSHLLKAKDPETGMAFDHNELVAEASLLIVGGTDTTITAMTATFFYLLKNPDALNRVQAEVRTTFLAVEDIRMGPKLEGCSFLAACIQESLRLCPPVGSILPREVLPGGIRVDGEYFPAGTDLGVPHYAIHHNAEYYPDPYQYRPERWLTENGGAEDDTGERLSKAQSAFTAFGVGRTSCIGKHLAEQEMRLAISHVLWLYDMRLSDDSASGRHERKGGSTVDKRSNSDDERVDEFPTLDRFVSMHDGPMVQFRYRRNRD